MRKALLLLATATISIAPAAAQQLRYLNPQDVAEAQREHAVLVQELGGAETGPRAAYVEMVGRRVAAYSGLANPAQALHFTTLNSAVENAFSVPGGYVYVTRQLMSLMDDELELAFALGHEVGHVAANHAHAREQYVQRSSASVLGSILGAIFGNSVVGSVLQQRARLDTLSFSRTGISGRRTWAEVYDPGGLRSHRRFGNPGRAQPGTSLQARLQGRTNRQTPEWASTHPLSENRMQRALADARATGRLGSGIRNRDGFLRELQGIMIDDDPVQGVIDGPTFTHPDLRIQFTVPPGYLMSNGTRAVTISGSAGKAQFGGGSGFKGSLEDYILRVFQELTRGQRQLPIPPPTRTTINGIPVAYTTTRVNGSSGLIDVSVVAYQWDAQHFYYFVTLTPGGYGLIPSHQW